VRAAGSDILWGYSAGRRAGSRLRHSETEKPSRSQIIRDSANYGVALPEMQRVGSEVRMRCFLKLWAKGRDWAAGAGDPGRPSGEDMAVFEAGCGRGGNLVSLCDLMKPGEHAEGKPRGERFKAILKDLQAMAAGTVQPEKPSAVEEHGPGGDRAKASCRESAFNAVRE